MRWSKLAFERLLDSAHRQVTALDQASASDPARSGALGTRLWRVIERVDRIASLLVVQTAGAHAMRSWPMARQRWLADKLDALHGSAEPLLARVLPENAITARRFATRLSLLDPLTRFRGGPDGIVDIADKLITGRSLHDVLEYRERELGVNESPTAVIPNVSLCGADLSVACLSNVWMLDLDASGANLDEALALEARLTRVNLTGASMCEMELQGSLARDCDFSGASLVGARWHDGTAVLCSFGQTDLADLRTDRAMFLHCDFRGANLEVYGGSSSVTMTGAQFLDCDFRDSRWHGRTLQGGRFVRCKLQGLIGAPLFEDIEIDSPDLSGDGNDSKVAL
jgi:uncharacterized protein YjbI with pentapeptide repeats